MTTPIIQAGLVLVVVPRRRTSEKSVSNDTTLSTTSDLRVQVACRQKIDYNLLLRFGPIVLYTPEYFVR